MRLNKNTVISLVALLAFLIIIVFLFWNNSRSGYKYKWSENYYYDNDQPYGLKINHALLTDYFPEEELTVNTEGSIEEFMKTVDTSKTSTYVIFGRSSYYSKADVLTLRKYVEKGNTVFMSLSDLPSDFMFRVKRRCEYEYTDYDYRAKKFLHTQFIDSALNQDPHVKYYYQYGHKKSDYTWRYFNENLCDSTLDYKVLARHSGYNADFIQIQYGEGQILLHCNPLYFSNFHMLRPEAANYASKVYSYFPEGPIYWDKHSKFWSFKPNTEGNVDETPFTWILKQRSFKWAYYTLWILTFIFLAFNLWRKQRPIPVKFKNENTSLEFMKTVGELYYSAKNNHRLASQKMDFFMKWARQKYYINDSDQEEIIKKLSKKADRPETELRRIFKQFERVQNNSMEITDNFLVGFYKNIENFKKKSK